MKNDSQIIVSTDIDWASDWMLEYFFDLVLAKVPKVLAFSTHNTKILEKYHSQGFVDIGAHPNFRKGSSHGSNIKEVAEFVSNLFITKKIYRAHGLLDSKEIRSEMKRNGFTYESNVLNYNEPDLLPKKLEENILRIPIFWSDGWALRDPTYQVSGLCEKSIEETKFFLKQPGLKVLNIHPILLVNNCYSLQHYEKFRTRTVNFSRDDYYEFRNVETLGTCDYFFELIKIIESHCNFLSIEDIIS